MTNYNGLMLKVFDLKFEQQELIKSDSLIKRGYKKFPYMDWLEVPYRLKKYMNSNDSGYYLNDESHGERYLIIDYTSHKFILYDMGLLIDIYRPDSLNGKIK